MATTKHTIALSLSTYEVLVGNDLISLACARQLKPVSKRDDMVRLSMVLAELQELIGYVAAEANHARSIRQSEAFNWICDELESLESDIKWSMK